jgi:peptidoglycan/LPS O-acetylase OafA/YrhL
MEASLQRSRSTTKYPQNRPVKQIQCLTSMRFFAAAMIVLFHSVDVFKVGTKIQTLFPLEQGVSFFFVLSGFILTYVYPSLNGGSQIRGFYVARIARIWPAHFVTFLLLLCLVPPQAWRWDGTWQVLCANLSLFHGWIPMARYYFSLNSVSWSISTEAFFYLSFPFLISRLNRSWWWKLLCTAAVAVAILCLNNFLNVPSYSLSNYSAVTSRGLAYISPFVRILEFVFGMSVANFCLQWKEHEIVTSSPGWLWSLFELGAIAIAFFSGWYGLQFDVLSKNGFAVYVACCGSFPAFGLLIGILSFERGIVSHFLSTGWLVLLGEISFSIYLVHQIVSRYYSQNSLMFASIPKTALFLGYWLVVLGLSFLIWRLVEKPCQRLIRSLYGLKRPAKRVSITVPPILDP